MEGRFRNRLTNDAHSCEKYYLLSNQQLAQALLKKGKAQGGPFGPTKPDYPTTPQINSDP